MALLPALYTTLLTWNCPCCGQPHEKRGSWFQSAQQMTCQHCGAQTRLTYNDKVALFERHRPA